MLRVVRIAFVIAAIGAFVMAALPRPPPLPGDPPDKLLHIVAFLVLGGLAAVGFQRWTPLRLVIALGLYGAAIELVQAIPALRRDSDVMDLIADIAAALVAVWTTRAVMQRKRR